MATAFNRNNPSPRYIEYMEMYREMHLNGDKSRSHSPEKTFNGRSLKYHLRDIRELISNCSAKSILDYGSGKGMVYKAKNFITRDGHTYKGGLAEFWGVDEIVLYDPAYEPHNKLPEKTFNGVVCTDVVEHIPEEDLEWTVDELFGFANRFLFVSAAGFAAASKLPNGENAHCTLRPSEWWNNLFARVGAHHPTVRWHLIYEYFAPNANGVWERQHLYTHG